MSDDAEIILLAGVGLLAFAAWQTFGSAGDASSSGSGDVSSLEQIASTYADAIAQASSSSGVRKPIIIGVIAKESGGNPNAVGDGGQALGLMQMHAAAADEVGFDWSSLTDPTTAILAGAAYLGKYIGHFGSEALGLVAYNQGPGVASAGSADPRFATGQTYAAAVLSFAQQVASFLDNLAANPPELIPSFAPQDFNPFDGVTD